MPELDALLARFHQGDRLALSRLLSLLARGEQAPQILSALPAPAHAARVVAITGSAGVGKSTLIGKLIEEVRRQRLRVAVLACDPQSSVSGGALLGDRFRMPDRAGDNGVFIRSLAARSGHGGLAEHLADMTRLLTAFGFDVVIIETVGAGQGDVAVADLADVVVLLLQPETGDDLQWEKAGVLEVADIIAVQKADLPRAEQVAAQVRSMLALSSAPTAVPVLLVSARTGQGVAELWQTIAVCHPRPHNSGAASDDLVRLAHAALARRLAAARAAGDNELEDLARRWRQGLLGAEEAGEALLHILQAPP
jgi:LAO/AO transport system ATPase